jgi:hypothetical protein
MTKFTDDERMILRSKFGTAYVAIQENYKDRDVVEVTSEMISAVLSLGLFVGRKSGIDKAGAIRAVLQAVEDEYRDA